MIKLASENKKLPWVDPPYKSGEFDSWASSIQGLSLSKVNESYRSKCKTEYSVPHPTLFGAASEVVVRSRVCGSMAPFS